MVTLLMMSAKLATQSLLKIKIFRKKGYYVPNYYVSNKILSRDSDYAIDLAMRLKFSSSSISMIEVIVTSIL